MGKRKKTVFDISNALFSWSIEFFFTFSGTSRDGIEIKRVCISNPGGAWL